MADYIVKSNGTATLDAGRYTTPQTGSFDTLGVSNYYVSISAAEAATTTPVAGDRVLFSDLSAFTQTGLISLGIKGVLYVINLDSQKKRVGLDDLKRMGIH